MPVYTLFSFAAAQNELTLRLGGRSDSSSGIPFSNRTANWLNSAQLLMAKCPIAFPDLEQTSTINLVDGQAEYNRTDVAPPLTDMIGIEQIQIVDTVATPILKQRAQRFPWREYRAISLQASARPTRWARKGDVIAFDPIPDKAGYQAVIDYRKRPVLNGVSIDAEYQEHWIKLAESMAWNSLGQNERASQTYAQIPTTLRAWLDSPLDGDQWDAMQDPDLGIKPMGWDRGWRYSG
jgi:hypothetical protein